MYLTEYLAERGSLLLQGRGGGAINQEDNEELPHPPTQQGPFHCKMQDSNEADGGTRGGGGVGAWGGV